MSYKRDTKNITVGALIEQLRAFDPDTEVVSAWDCMEMACYGVLDFGGTPVLLVDEDDLTVERLIDYGWKLEELPPGRSA